MAKPDIQQIKQRFGIIGTAPALNRAIDIALQVASTDLSVSCCPQRVKGTLRRPFVLSNREHLESPGGVVSGVIERGYVE